MENNQIIKIFRARPACGDIPDAARVISIILQDVRPLHYNDISPSGDMQYGINANFKSTEDALDYVCSYKIGYFIIFEYELSLIEFVNAQIFKHTAGIKIPPTRYYVFHKDRNTELIKDVTSLFNFA